VVGLFRGMAPLAGCLEALRIFPSQATLCMGAEQVLALGSALGGSLTRLEFITLGMLDSDGWAALPHALPALKQITVRGFPSGLLVSEWAAMEQLCTDHAGRELCVTWVGSVQVAADVATLQQRLPAGSLLMFRHQPVEL